MDQVMRICLVFFIASLTICQKLPVNYMYNPRTVAEGRICPAKQDLIESIEQDIHLLIRNSVLPALSAQNETQIGNASQGHGACGCGGPGWRRAAYLNMSDPTQTCPPAWELITTPRRCCARPYSSHFNSQTCFSTMFPTQGIQYSQVCGRIIGYQKGTPSAFRGVWRYGINGPYADGVSLTYGNPRKHIWTFVNALDEYPLNYDSKCPCTHANVQHTYYISTFIGNDYFCETGVPPGQSSNFQFDTLYADDPLWDGQGCGLNSTCCTFNNPPWFCKQLPQSTNADLEVRLCSYGSPSRDNTPVELIEIYVK